MAYLSSISALALEPDLRPTASELLKHPFVSQESQGVNLGPRSSLVGSSGRQMAALGASCSAKHSEHFVEHGSLCQPSNNDDDDDMCRIDDIDDMCRIDDNDDLVLGAPTRFRESLLHRDANQSFNPMCEPNDDWPCKFDESPTMTENYTGFTFPTAVQSGPEDDDEVTESKITAFLDEKALELKKLQSPLYQFYNSLNVTSPPSPFTIGNKENVPSNCNLPPKSKSPNRSGCRRFSTAFDVDYSSSPKSFSRRISNIGDVHSRASKDVKELLLDSQGGEPLTPSCRFFEIQRKWKEELDEELERTRELMRQAGTAKTSSPKDQTLNRYRDRLRFASPGK